jgi:hypothetical protein
MKLTILCSIAILSFARAAPTTDSSSAEPALAAQIASMIPSPSLAMKSAEQEFCEKYKSEGVRWNANNGECVRLVEYLTVK